METRPDCHFCDTGCLDFYTRYKRDFGKLLELCQDHKVILKDYQCEKCGNKCRLDANAKVFRCDKWRIIEGETVHCQFQRNVFHKTWFDKTSVDVHTTVTFANLFFQDFLFDKTVKSELLLSDESVDDLSSLCWEVLISWCLDHQAEQLGGEGEIVEIDECEFGNLKRSVGGVIDAQWVFGGVCRKTQEFFLVPVIVCDADTILKVIKGRVKPGTTIISDCWRDYDCLSKEGFEDLRAKHSIKFVDPKITAKINIIERLRRKDKAQVPRYGKRNCHFVGHLARLMFCMSISCPNKRFHDFFLAVARLYPPQ